MLVETLLEDDAAPSIVFIETADARLSAKMLSLGMFENYLIQKSIWTISLVKFKLRALATDSRRYALTAI